VIQLDTVVQQNAAASEETASSAEELQSQVVTLNEGIETLSVLVLGGSHNRSKSVTDSKVRALKHGSNKLEQSVEDFSEREEELKEASI